MIFRVTMKDPDTLHDAVRDAVRKDVTKLKGILPAEVEKLQEMRSSEVLELCSRWFRYSEYLTVEIDTVKRSITVVESAGNRY